MMKKFLALLTLMFIFYSTTIFALANPSAVYCNEMNKEFGGYQYVTQIDAQSNEYGICVMPDGTRCDAWDFLNGKCGADYSFCAKNGGMATEGSTCIAAGGSGGNKMLKASAPQEFQIIELMNLTEKLGGDITPETLNSQLAGLASGSETSLETATSQYNASNYPYWDWRSPPSSTMYAASNYHFFDASMGWLTSVKDQAQCGSCWSFGIMGSMEAKYNIVMNESRLKPDLSEQHEVSCDHSCYPFPFQSSCNSGCAGGYPDLALNYIKNNAVVDEKCFPYADASYGEVNGSSKSCSDSCSDSSSRLWSITGYQGNHSVTNAKLEQMLIDNGPIIISVHAGDNGWYYYPGSGVECNGTWSSTDHVVVLVGYNSTGNYWIIKNSWGGSWGNNGYINVGFGCDGVGTEVYYPVNVTPPNFKPTIVVNAPTQYVIPPANPVFFNFTVNNRNATTSTCDLSVNGSVVNSTTANNGASTVMSYAIPVDVTNNWSVRCWETDFGIINSTQTRNISIDTIPPSIAILSPANNTMYNASSIRINISVIEVHPDSTWFFNGTANETYASSVLRAFTDGNYNLTVWSNDTVGHLSAASVNFTVDSIPPTISFTSPTVDSSSFLMVDHIPINVSADDANLANITIYLYNSSMALINSATTTDPNLFANFSGLPDDTYYFNATAYDLVNHVNSTATWNVTLDTLPPSIAILSPSNNTMYNASSIRINISVIEVHPDSTWFFNGTANETYASSVLRTFTDGNYNLTVWSNDTAGHLSTAVANFSVDTRSPTVSFTSPTIDSSSFLMVDHIPINVSADDANLANITIYLYNSSMALINSATTTDPNLFANFSGLPDGIYYFNATAYDAVGHANSTATWNITLDTLPPSIAILSPANNTMYNASSIRINISVIEVHPDSTWFFNGTANESYASSVLRAFTDGNYNLTVWSNDTAGHLSTAVANFSVDTRSPTVSFTSPTVDSSSFLMVDHIPINVSADDANLANITIYLYNSSMALINSATTTDPNLFANFSGLPDDTYYFNATAYDLVNHVNSTATWNVTLDTLPPSIAILSPANNTMYNASSIRINISVIEVHPDSTWFFNGTANETYASSVLRAFTDGNYNLTVWSNDTVGHLSAASVNFTVDSIPPTISFMQPTVDSSSFLMVDHIPINVSADDANLANITIYLYNSSMALINSATTTDPNLFANFSGLPDGIYYFNATAYDAVGHANSTATWNITLDTIAPIITIRSPVNNTMYTNSTIRVNISVNEIHPAKTWFFNGTANETYASSVLRYFTEGDYNLTVWSNDTAGHLSTAVANFSVDTRSPTVSFTSPTVNSSSFFAFNYIPINVSATDAHIANITIYLYNSSKALINSATTADPSLFANFTGLPDGTYYFNATAYDALRHVNKTATWNVTLDSTPPAITINSPANNTLYNTSSIRVNISVVEAHPSKTWFSNGTANMTYTRPVNKVYADGDYNLTVWSNDTAGHLSTAAANFSVDTRSPAISFVAPTFNSSSVLQLDHIQANVSAGDAHLANITIRLYNSSKALINSATTTDPNLFANFTGLPDGTYYFNATAYDALRHVNKTATWNVTLDTIAPIITIRSPINNTLYNTSSIRVNISVVEAHPSKTWFSNGTTNQTYTSSMLRNFADGDYNLTVWSNDTAGHLSTAAANFSVDTRSPAISFVAPTFNSSSSLLIDYIQVNVSASDVRLANITIYLYNSSKALINSATTADPNLFANFTGLPDGTYYFNATAYDALRHVNKTATWNVSLDK